MTEEEKQLLLIELCARLPYGVKCKIDFDSLLKTFSEYEVNLLYSGVAPNVDLRTRIGERVYTLFGVPTKHRLSFLELDGFFDEYDVPVECVKPCLRPIHKLTKEELEELEFLTDSDYVDYCNEHHIDYRNLIPKGLALEAKEGMYKNG